MDPRDSDEDVVSLGYTVGASGVKPEGDEQLDPAGSDPIRRRSMWVKGDVVVGGLAADHVGHVNLAVFEEPGGGIDEPVVLGAAMGGL